MKKKFGKLPGVPSKLIKLALKDLKLVEKDRRYRISMNTTWHEPNGKCTVCFAGAVMAKALKVSPKEEATPWSCEDASDALKALDEFRQGNVANGLWIIGIKEQSLKADDDGNYINYAGRFDRKIISYSKRTKKKFHQQMQKLADDLKRSGY